MAYFTTKYWSSGEETGKILKDIYFNNNCHKNKSESQEL